MSIPTPAGEPSRDARVDPYLLEQLDRWPTRVDPSKTINIQYLMRNAARTIRALSRPVHCGEGDVERVARYVVEVQGMDWNQLGGGDHGYWCSLARAAITALQSPGPVSGETEPLLSSGRCRHAGADHAPSPAATEGSVPIEQGEVGFNGMTDDEQPPIPLNTATLTVHIETSAHLVIDDAMRERMAGAIWRTLPPAEDGDVSITEEPK